MDHGICSQLWDVCSDEEAVEIVERSRNAQDASQRLLDHALAYVFSSSLSSSTLQADILVIRGEKIVISVPTI